MQPALLARVTFAVAIVIHLDLGASEAGITVQLTVVQVRLAIAPAHRPLVRFAFLWESQRTQHFTCLLGTARGRQVSPYHQPNSGEVLGVVPLALCLEQANSPIITPEKPTQGSLWV